jgi:hypothetical protein
MSTEINLEVILRLFWTAYCGTAAVACVIFGYVEAQGDLDALDDQGVRNGRRTQALGNRRGELVKVLICVFFCTIGILLLMRGPAPPSDVPVTREVNVWLGLYTGLGFVGIVTMLLYDTVKGASERRSIRRGKIAEHELEEAAAAVAALAEENAVKLAAAEAAPSNVPGVEPAPAAALREAIDVNVVNTERAVPVEVREEKPKPETTGANDEHS